MKDLSQRSRQHSPRPFSALEGEKVADRPDGGSPAIDPFQDPSQRRHLS